MAPESTAARALPEELRGLFWEHDFDRLSLARDRDLIFRKVLADGPWPAVQWLRRQAGSDAIRLWIEERRGRPLSRKQLRFWQLILGLPPAEVDAWLAARENDPWEGRCRA